MKEKVELVVSFNKEWALKVGEKKWKEHFKSIYPDHDLNAEWEKISPKK